MKKNNKELIRFLIAGFSAVGMDLISYNILLNFFNYNIAKGVAFFLGTVIAYFVNN